MEAIILIGIQAAGKTSFYRERFFETHVRISLDMLRTRRREEILVKACLAAKQPFVVDNTNVRATERARYIALARAARFRVTGYFFEPEPNASYARVALRTGRDRIPPAGLFGTLKRFERPRLEEGFDELFRVLIPGPGQFEVKKWSND